MLCACQQLSCKPQGHRPVIILSLCDGSSDNFAIASMLGGEGSEVRNREETAAPVLYIDGTDTCHELRFEFASPHCCLSPSEHSSINIGRCRCPHEYQSPSLPTVEDLLHHRLAKYVLCISMRSRTWHY